MTLDNLLERLRDVDPHTFDIREAILQECLQQAIKSRGWGLQQFHYMGGSKRCVAAIFTQEKKMFEQSADSPADALLAAFIEAIQ
jgi:hypothetical protein